MIKKNEINQIKFVLIFLPFIVQELEHLSLVKLMANITMILVSISWSGVFLLLTHLTRPEVLNSASQDTLTISFPSKSHLLPHVCIVMLRLVSYPFHHSIVSYPFHHSIVSCPFHRYIVFDNYLILIFDPDIVMMCNLL